MPSQPLAPDRQPATLVADADRTSPSAVYIFQTFEQGDPLRGMAMAVLMIGTTTIGLLLLRRLAGDRFA